MASDAQVKILLAEDDPNLGFILSDFLELKGHSVVWTKDGMEAFEAFRPDKFDLCIFDIMMPRLDGFSLAQKIRNIDPEIPFIFLTAKTMKEDRIKGLKLGADDYITKPFSTEELGLRVTNLMKRYRKGTTSMDESDCTYELGAYLFDATNQILSYKGEEKRLTKKESEVFKVLCCHKGQLVKRDFVLKQVWGDDDYFMGRSMDVYIAKLRKYLSKDPSVSITNVHGSGFLLDLKK